LFQNPLAHRDYYWSLASLVNTSEPSVDAIVKGSCERVPGLFEAFKRQAISQVCADLRNSCTYIYVCIYVGINLYIHLRNV
jgi:hypothetical protein